MTKYAAPTPFLVFILLVLAGCRSVPTQAAPEVILGSPPAGCPPACAGLT
ncbi:MAG TPA: hypothetical protein VGD99_03560 [Anaerolineae bacterium]